MNDKYSKDYLCEFNDFWDGKLLGLTFWGNDVNSYGESFCIRQNIPIYILGESRTRVNAAVDFMNDKGFYVIEASNKADGWSVDELEGQLRDISLNNELYAIMLADKSIYKNHIEVWNGYLRRTIFFDKVRIFLDVFLPQLKKVYELIEDEYSREVFTAVLCHRFKIFGRKVLYPYICSNQYFCIPQQTVLNIDEVFVDCGAFVGDTVENLLRARGGILKKIYSFEPFTDAFNALAKRSSRLKEEWMLEDDSIMLVKGGCGAKRCQMKICVTGSNMATQLKEANDDSNDNIEVYSLDDFFKNQYVSFIKADIEGMEMDMLRGAKNIIKRDKPNLAICIYHKLTDYYEIPIFIKSLVPEYTLAIRHHSSSIEETVLYCYIESNL